MSVKLIPKPVEGEYAPYTIMYIGLLPDDGLILKHLQDNLDKTVTFMRSLPKEKLTVPWAKDEWTIKEILLHIIDDERIYCYRALRFARNDTTDLPGFEQDEYVPYSGANSRDLESMIEEFVAVRQSTITLFKNLDEAALLRKGVGSGNIMSVRAAVYHIGGHELHHINSIKENYLLG
ncbi:MAG: DinB family protein [Chloroflexota bacterium]